MNILQADLLTAILNNPKASQRKLAEITGLSLGAVNKTLKELTDASLLDYAGRLTEKAEELILNSKPKNAVILAAGFGMRMVPINLSAPKAFLEVNGEPLIERIIHQLHEAGIKDIAVVAGFMKESFEYLMDDFGVDLIINSEYASRNNLHSLALAADRIDHTYIIPCDVWAKENPFHETELYSWYMVSDSDDEESAVRVNRKNELLRIKENQKGNRMIGISYLAGKEAETVREKLKKLDRENKYDSSFWETALYEKDRMIVNAKTVPSDSYVEINTYEQLRDLDSHSSQLQSDAIRTICDALHAREYEVKDIQVLKKGMTNRSFLFSVRDRKYIMRIPGEGTDRLINRVNEAAVYQAISGKGLCDDPVYINPANGYKITAFLDDVRVCDPLDENDLRKCMKILKQFHEMKLQVPHEFDIFRQIDFYESLWNGASSMYRDYRKTKEKVFSLRSYIDSAEKEYCLTHIDAVPDNFLFYCDQNGEEQLQLTDWEYAGMQDPHVDIAMFIIYSLYNKTQADRLIDIYFEGNCGRKTRAKIYCYIAMCGLLWSNWCEFKSILGVEFGEYSLRQYRFAKDYSRYAEELMKEEDA